MVWIKLKTVAVTASLLLGVVASPRPDVPDVPVGTEGPFVPAAYHVPQYYPAPYGGWVKDWQESYSKARDFVDSMTLAEKTNITAGCGIFMGKFQASLSTRRTMNKDD